MGGEPLRLDRRVEVRVGAVDIPSGQVSAGCRHLSLGDGDGPCQPSHLLL